MGKKSSPQPRDCNACESKHLGPINRNCKLVPKHTESEKQKHISKQIEQGQKDADAQKKRAEEGAPLMTQEVLDAAVKQVREQMRMEAELAKEARKLVSVDPEEPSPGTSRRSPSPDQIRLGKERSRDRTVRTERGSRTSNGWRRTEVDEDDGFRERSHSRRGRTARYERESDYDTDHEDYDRSRYRKKKSALDRTGSSQVEFDLKMPHFYVWREGRSIKFDDMTQAEFGVGFAAWANDCARTVTDFIAINKLYHAILTECVNGTWPMARDIFRRVAIQAENGLLKFTEVDKVTTLINRVKNEIVGKKWGREAGEDYDDQGSRKGKSNSKRPPKTRKHACYAWNNGTCTRTGSHDLNGKMLSHVCIDCNRKGKEETHRSGSEQCPYKKDARPKN